MVPARLVLPVAALFAVSLNGQELITIATSGPAVGGIIRDAAGAPVSEVEVGVISGERLQQFMLTDADGKFLLTGVRAGVVPLRVRRLGFAMQYLDVDARQPSSSTLEIVLKPVASELEDVMIPGIDTRLHEFYERKQQRSTFARFLEQADIRRAGARHASDLFRSVPGTVISAASGGNTIRIRGCQPMVWLDGQRVPGAELDEVIQPSEIAAIEFYPSSAGIPAQYLERGNRLCGLVLVWTRTR